MQDIVLELVSRLLIPLIQLLGAYVLLHGHLSPGGAFSGGTIIATSFILYSLTFRFSRKRHPVKHDTSLLLESGGVLLYVCVGLLGILLGYRFLSNQGVFPLGTPGRLWSSGLILVVTLGLGLKVASTVFTLFQELLEGGTELDGHD